MSLTAIQDKVIVRVQEAQSETAGGIIIANASNEGITQGEVLSIGAGTYDNAGKFVATTAKVGNEILFNLNGGLKFEHKNEEYVTITEREIIAILN